MSDDAAIRSCPQCGSPIPADAPGALCPKCVLARAAAETEAGQPEARPEVPPLESVRAAFPQLEVLELIGQGGMGFVYKARQVNLDRLVALKLLWPKLASDSTFAERFSREARVLARLNHPNIVAVYDFGHSGGFFYLLMEYVDGVNMRQAMRSGRFSPAEALALVPRICDALQYAHEEGVLHRDIKPENILLDAKGRLKIADFGIAKILGSARGKITLTDQGLAVGTPHYMAPEQLEHPQDVDQRADVYSLGVVFYEMLTGELPVGRFAPPSQKTPVDPRVDDVVLRALEKEREKRYRSAGEVKTRVEDIRSTPPPLGPHGTLMAGQGPPGTSGHASVSAGAGMPEPPVMSSQYRWSGKAILAAILDAAALVPALFLLFISPFVHVAAVAPGPPLWVRVLKPLLLFLGVCGIPALGGMVLGLAALRDIMRAGDRLRGRALALCAALYWPMLFAYTLVLILGGHLGTWLAGATRPGLTLLIIPAALLAAVALGWAIATAVWRWTNPVGKPKPGPLAWPVGASVLIPLILPVLGFMIASFFLVRVATPLPEWSQSAGVRVPSSGSISPRADASFTLPAGQVAVFEIVSRENQSLVPVSGLGAYIIAPPGQTISGTFICGPQPDANGNLNLHSRWKIEISGGGNSSMAGGFSLPEPLVRYGGQISTSRTLQPDAEFIIWAGTSNSGDPQHPTLGLRIRTQKVARQLAKGNFATGIGTNWLKAISAPEAAGPP